MSTKLDRLMEDLMALLARHGITDQDCLDDLRVTLEDHWMHADDPA